MAKLTHLIVLHDITTNGKTKFALTVHFKYHTMYNQCVCNFPTIPRLLVYSHYSKKPGSDPSDHDNCRAISYLPFSSKILKKIV